MLWPQLFTDLLILSICVPLCSRNTSASDTDVASLSFLLSCFVATPCVNEDVQAYISIPPTLHQEYTLHIMALRCSNDNNRKCLQGLGETSLSFQENGGMNVTGLRLVDFSNQTAKAFVKTWQGLDSSKWSGTGHNRITVSGFAECRSVCLSLSLCLTLSVSTMLGLTIIFGNLRLFTIFCFIQYSTVFSDD